jgi:hypothetical protein
MPRDVLEGRAAGGLRCTALIWMDLTLLTRALPSAAVLLGEARLTMVPIARSRKHNTITNTCNFNLNKLHRTGHKVSHNNIDRHCFRHRSDARLPTSFKSTHNACCLQRWLQQQPLGHIPAAILQQSPEHQQGVATTTDMTVAACTEPTSSPSVTAASRPSVTCPSTFSPSS